MTTLPEVDLQATDASGIQVTTWALDATTTNPGKVPWIAGTEPTLTTEGAHKVLFRSVDDFGNAERVRSAWVRVDSRAPTPRAPYRVRASSGSTAGIKFRVDDPRPGSPTVNVTIKIKNAGGHVVKSIRLKGCRVGRLMTSTFRCSLKRGSYRFFIYAKDLAGNQQTRVASNVLRVT